MSRLFYSITKIVIIFSLLVLESCISCHKETERDEIQYDLYEVKIKSSLNVRATPDPNAPKLGALYNNEKVNVVNINDGWAKIKYGSQYAYVSSKYLTLINKENKANSHSNDITAEKGATSGELNSQNKFESDSIGSKKMALIFDNANVLSPEDYTMINQAYGNINAFLILWTVESIDKGDILDYNNQIVAKLEEEPYKKYINTNKPSGIEDEDIYWVTFIKDLGLMQVENESGVMNLINISMPDKYLHMQLKAKQNGLQAGLMDLSSLIKDATVKYKDNNWFVRIFINSSSLGEMITESLFKEQILPSDGFFYKYIFSWLTKIPCDFLNFLIAGMGSLSYAMIFLCLLYTIATIVKTNVLGGGYKQGETRKLTYLLLIILFSVFLFVCLVILIFYTMCNMTDITAMQMYGWNNEMITTVTEHNLNHHISRSWWLSLLFFIGMFIYKLPNAWISVASILPSKKQQALAQNNPSHFEDHQNLTSSESPYSDLFGDKAGEATGSSIFIIIVLTLLLNGTSMMYATVFTCSLMIGKIYGAIKLYLKWKSYGYFN